LSHESGAFSKPEADRILRRAAEIEGSVESGPLSAAELRIIAREAGFGAEAVDRAIAEVRDAEAAQPRWPPVQKWGVIVTHLSAIREIPVEISSDALMRAVRLAQPYRDGPPQVGLDEREVTWRDRKGLKFGIRSGGGVTAIRVTVSKLLVRRGRWMGWVRAAADRLETLVALVALEEDTRR
jgi:hypothetical protein